jgi:hypothetical protein
VTLSLGRHQALPALRAHTGPDDDPDPLDVHITLYRERKPVRSGRLFRAIRLHVCDVRRVVMVPDGIPRHMADAEILHEQNPTPAAQLPGRRTLDSQVIAERDSADVRLDGDEMAPDADDGDAGHATAAYMALDSRLRTPSSASDAWLCSPEFRWDLCPGCDRPGAGAVYWVLGRKRHDVVVRIAVLRVI